MDYTLNGCRCVPWGALVFSGHEECVRCGHLPRDVLDALEDAREVPHREAESFALELLDRDIEALRKRRRAGAAVVGVPVLDWYQMTPGKRRAMLRDHIGDHESRYTVSVLAR